MSTLTGFGHGAPAHRAGSGRRGASPQFAAVLDALLDARPRFARLAFEEFACVDGLLFGRSAGHADFRHYVGPRLALIDAIERMAASLSISPLERASALLRIAEIPDVEPARPGEESAA